MDAMANANGVSEFEKLDGELPVEKQSCVPVPGQVPFFVIDIVML